MDAITLLKNDHRTVETLFKRFERLGDGNGKDKKAVVQQIVRELSIHAAIEEQLFYPAVRNSVKDAKDIILESLEEHHIVKWTLSELDSMTLRDERFDAKVNVLMESVRHHVEEEEQELFPKVMKTLGRESLEALGAAMERAKKMAPTHPHPRAPDTPPGNIIAGLPAALLDRVKDMVQGVAKRGQAKAKTGATMRGGMGAKSNEKTSTSMTGTRGKITTSRATSPRIAKAGKSVKSTMSRQSGRTSESSASSKATGSSMGRTGTRSSARGRGGSARAQ